MIKVENNGFTTGSNLTILKFTATWCGPCRMINPFVKELSSQFENKGVVINDIDVDTNSELATRFDIRAVPTILFLKDGAVVDKTVGAVQKSVLESKIENLLSK
jgi:thioredoxin 1